MAQVKFYSVSELPNEANAGGVYFVDGGELYKGTQRFGLGRVTVDADFNPSTSTKAGQARGDIVVTGAGAAWVFTGSAWESIGGDTAALQSMWRNDISVWTSALSVGDANSYITSISQAEDGKVTAHAESFGTKVLEAVGNGSASGSGNGITVSVVTTSGSVTGVQVAATDLSVNSIYASDATFDSTTVTASTLTVTGGPSTFTVGGSTIPDYIDNAIGALAASTVTASANGIEVGVTTQSGKVTGVSVSANAISAESGTFETLTVTDTATFSATTVSADTLTIGGSTVEQLADKQIAAIASHTETSTALGITVSVTTSAGSVSGVYVDATSFGNAMHFVGVKNSTGAVASPASGDIVVIGSTPAEGFVAGQEYIYDGTNWELIGDQATYATKAAVEASWSTLGTAAFVDTATTVAADATTLPTGGAVASYVSSVIDGLAGSASDADKGVTVEVVTADGEVSTVDVAVTAASTMALNATGSADELATTAAIKSFYDNNLVWLDANGNAI